MSEQTPETMGLDVQALHLPEIRVVKMGLIRPYWNNPRQISEEAVDRVRRSIERYGYNQPIVLDRENVIIVGHVRFKALMQLNAAEALCVIADLDHAKAAEYRIIDNKTAEGTEWDIHKLLLELDALDTERMQSFFPDMDIEETLRGMKRVGTAELEDLGLSLGGEADRGKLPPPGEPNGEELSSDIELVCPECGFEFTVSRQQILGASDETA